jgi:hypothetical protein
MTFRRVLASAGDAGGGGIVSSKRTEAAIKWSASSSHVALGAGDAIGIEMPRSCLSHSILQPCSRQQDPKRFVGERHWRFARLTILVLTNDVGPQTVWSLQITISTASDGPEILNHQ